MDTGWSDDRELNSPLNIPSLVATAEEHHDQLTGLKTHYPLRNDYLSALSRFMSEWNAHMLSIGVAEHYPAEGPAEISITAAGLDQIDFELYRLPLDETHAWINQQLPPARDRSRLLVGSWSGEELGAKVVVEYYSGGPAVGAKIELTIIQHSINTLAENYRNQSQIEPIKLVVETDAAGVASFEWQAINTEHDEVFISLNADIIPRGGQPIQTATSWNLTKSGNILERDEPNAPQLVHPNQTLAFKGRVLTGATQPVPFLGTAELIQLS